MSFVPYCMLGQLTCFVFTRHFWSITRVRLYMLMFGLKSEPTGTNMVTSRQRKPINKEIAALRSAHMQ